MNRFAVWFAALLAGLSMAISAAGLQGAQLRDEAISISKELRCPASVNMTLHESEAMIANQLKAQIYRSLREGKGREEIIQAMVDRYGENIRYKPGFSAGTAALWAAPWVALLAVGFFLLRRRTSARRNVSGERK